MLNRLWKDTAFAVIDVETTSFNRKRAYICEVACVTVRSEGILTPECYQSLIDPGRRIDADATQLHGIDDEAVRYAPTFWQQKTKFLSYLSGKIIVTHTSYDIGRLKRVLPDYEFPICLDSCRLARRVRRSRSGNSLPALIAEYGIDLLLRKHQIFSRQKPHCAGYDALATAWLFGVLLYERYPNATIGALKEICGCKII